MTLISKEHRDPKRRCKLATITGDCLEAAGIRIPNDGFAVIRQMNEIRVGDLVHCARITGETPGMLKQVKSIQDGVITKYGRRLEIVFEFCPVCGRLEIVFEFCPVCGRPMREGD